MVFSLCACSSQSENIPEPTAVPTAEPTPVPTPTPTPEVLHDPGAYFEDFRLRYADESGHDIVNADLGVLHFDENGYYTSGNTDLDGQIIELLKANVDPKTQTPMEMFKIMYDYVVWHFGYRFANMIETGSVDWEVDEALDMLENGKGNCYTYAALVTMIARSLGYQARAIAGEFKGGTHSWCDVELDGEHFLSDAEYQACNDVFDEMFMLTYTDKRDFHYEDPAMKN